MGLCIFRFDVTLSVIALCFLGTSTVRADLIFDSGDTVGFDSETDEFIIVRNSTSSVPTSLEIDAGAMVNAGFQVQGDSVVRVVGGEARGASSRGGLVGHAVDRSVIILSGGRIIGPTAGRGTATSVLVEGEAQLFIIEGESDSPMLSGAVEARDAAFVSVSGGTLGRFGIELLGESHAEIEGGAVKALAVREFATANVTGGSFDEGGFIDSLFADGSAKVEVSAGSFDMGALITGNAHASFSGGSLEHLNLTENAVVEIAGGEFGRVAVTDSSKVVVYGASFSIDGIGVEPGEITEVEGFLTATSAGGSTFSFPFERVFDRGTIQLVVPEPGGLSAILIALCAGLHHRRGYPR